jgi:hypothetical protein
LVGTTDGRGRQARGVDLEQGDVRVRIAADHLGGEFALVAQPDGDLVGAIHHMMVGDEIAVPGNDKARSHPPHGLDLAAGRRRRHGEVLKERRKRVVFIVRIENLKGLIFISTRPPSAPKLWC